MKTISTPIFGFLFSAFIFLFSFDGQSQNFEYATISIENATFSGGNIAIRRDEGGSFFGTPQWVADEAEQIPVAYVSGNAPRVNANFTIECSNAPDSILVRGIGPDGISFQERKLAISSSESDIHTFYYPSTSSEVGFASETTRFYKPFKIGWDISYDNGETWRAVDTTRNTFYVTRTTPQNEVGHFKWYQSVFDISCRNADMQSTETDIIAAVWSEFTDHVVLNYAGDSLHYYSPKNTYNTNLGALLNYKNAQCYTFAQLFLSTIKIQGIVRTNNYVYITPTYSTACGYSVNRFLVKNWEFGTATGSGCASFPFENTYSYLLPYPYTAYSFLTADVTDQEGIPGQCSSNPSSYFNNHQIALIDGIYYDACYGVTFDSFESIPYEAFSAWGYRYSSGGVTHARFTNNMAETVLSRSVTTF